MELEFRKQFKDATTLLLMMDHDSGYVEGAENSTSSSNGSDSSKEAMQMTLKQPENFFLNEDALLEKPDVSFTFSDNLPYEIDLKDDEESRKLFFSPEFINGSVPSQNSTTVYSGLENETSSDASAEIAVQQPILVCNDTGREYGDVLLISASESDMSLEQTFDPVIIERASTYPGSNYSETSPLKGFPRSTFDPEMSIITKTITEHVNKVEQLIIKSNLIEESRTPEKMVTKPVNPDISPDIFDEEPVNSGTSHLAVQGPITHPQVEEKSGDKLDQKLLKRTQKGMSGVPPPPSVTVVYMSAEDILTKFQQNKEYCFWNTENVSIKTEKPDTSFNSSSESACFSKSLLLSVDVAKAKSVEWPEAWDMRCHGLHYNCGVISEEIVDLCDKYQKRFVGAETQSTCSVFESQNLMSPSKRRATKPKWGRKSPGRRLSHLARRRITFSSANLQAGGSSLVGSRARQILVDAKKIDLLNRRRSPKKSPSKGGRKTPNKTPSKSPRVKTRTPSSSAKKKLAMRFRKLAGEFENSLPSTSQTSSANRALFKSPDRSTKSENKTGSRFPQRALFQSPNRDRNSSLFSTKSQDSYHSENRNQLRRALFTSPIRKNSPPKAQKSPFRQLGFEKKRKRSESEDTQPSKFQRSMSMDVRPSSSGVDKSLCRTQSELNVSLNRSQSQSELSEQHLKKLRWAVSGALQSQNVTNAHPQWKVFASVLARVTRRFFANQVATSGGGGAKLEGGTSERMQRIARYHVISVIKGKSADEIVSEYLRNRVKVQRPQGYVAPDEYNNARIKAPSGGKENVFTDRANTIESWEKRKLDQVSKVPLTDSKIERIRKVINFGDDR